MNKWLFAFLGFILAAAGAKAVVTNPIPGYVWTYLGPTLGADWQPSVAAQQITIVVAPGSAPPLVQAAANFVGDGVNDQGAITAAINSATTVSLCEDGGVVPTLHCHNKKARFHVICIPGIYNFGGTFTIPDMGEATLDCYDGVTVNGPSGALDGIKIINALRAQINLPQMFNANSTGCALSLVPTVEIRDTYIRAGTLFRTGQVLTGSGLCLNPGIATNRNISINSAWGFDFGVSATALGTPGTDPTIDTNIFELGFLRGNNHNLFINAPNRAINANTWHLNIDQTVANAIGIETNSAFDVFDVIIGNFIGATGTVIKLDSGALSNRFNTYPSVINIVGENGSTLANVISDNGVAGSNLISGLTRPATNQAFPADQTATASAVGVMLGIAGQITPVSTGNILVTISGTYTNSNANSGVNVQLFHGTGAAPANGAAITGTGDCRPLTYTTATPNFQTPFTITCLVAPLKLGTTYWLDLVYAAIGGTSYVKNVTVSPVETTQ